MKTFIVTYVDVYPKGKCKPCAFHETFATRDAAEKAILADMEACARETSNPVIDTDNFVLENAPDDIIVWNIQEIEINDLTAVQ